MRRRLLPLAVLFLTSLLVAGTALAQGASTTLSAGASTLSASASALNADASTALSASHDLSWNVVASGGRENMSSGAHSMDGTLGQTTIGLTSDAGELEVGYWHGLGAAVPTRLFLPALFKSAGMRGQP